MHGSGAQRAARSPRPKREQQSVGIVIRSGRMASGTKTMSAD
ncbi:hypothetical protein QO004_000416 [Rhizobium mesoamericanum]|nr:hypothetical protein [Rhizobium mesoamericanum]